MRRLVQRGVGAIIAAVFAVVLGATPSTALDYDYLAGHPVHFTSPGYNPGSCTGSWTVYGTSGSFVMTAGHCGWIDATVFGTGAAWGRLAYRKLSYHGAPSGAAGDSALIRYYSGVTPYQTVVDPLTGYKPAGNGQVTGKMPTSQQTVGTLVGKMGRTTGRTEGRIRVAFNWKGQRALCAEYGSAGGDSGGPVWRSDSQGLRAVGMHVGSIANGSGSRYGCYIPIDTLLSQWGASMNFHSRTLAQRTSDLMPESTSGEVPPLVTEADGWVPVED